MVEKITGVREVCVDPVALVIVRYLYDENAAVFSQSQVNQDGLVGRIGAVFALKLNAHAQIPEGVGPHAHGFLD